MGRAPCCDKANVKKGPWSPEEDAKLKEYIEKYGTGGNWIALPQKVGLKRCGKSCRLRWLNYLRPNIKHGEFSDEEDRIICTLFANIGSRWSIIAAQLPGRTDNDIKNYWNTKLKKKLMGFVNNNPSYNNPHRTFIINPPTLINQNPSDHHDQSTTTASTTTSLSHHQLLMPSSFYKDHHSNSYDHNYNSVTRSFSSSIKHQMSNNYSNPITTSFNNSSFLNFQDQDHHHMIDSVGHNSVQYYYPHVKDNNSITTTTTTNNNNLLMFGSSTNEGSCSTSSDGSCNYKIKQEEMGFHYRQGSFMGMLSNNNNNILNYNGNIIGDDIHDHHYIDNLNIMWGHHKSNGCFGDHDQHFSSSSCVVEDVKQQMISTSSDASNHLSFFINVDENKTQENKNLYF